MGILCSFVLLIIFKQFMLMLKRVTIPDNVL